jgi:hypothetical protein
MADPADFAHTPPDQATAHIPTLKPMEDPRVESDEPLKFPDRIRSQGSSNSRRWYGG